MRYEAQTVEELKKVFLKHYPEYKTHYIDSYAFGFGEEEAQTLGIKASRGEKRATSSLYRAYMFENDRVPEIGDCIIIHDGTGYPFCVLEITHIERHPFSEIDEEIARGEGVTLRVWREEHAAYFTQYLKKHNEVFTEDEEIFVEYFRVLMRNTKTIKRNQNA